MGLGSEFVLTLFTNDPALAAAASAAGVDRIGLDLERLGKGERQGGLSTWISDHSERDFERISPHVRAGSLFARCNPINDDSSAEIERLLSAGVRTIMLPYFKKVSEAERFLEIVGGRAHPVLLVETADAIDQVDSLCVLPGVREIHFGLNDLRLSLGWPSHFHVLVSPMLADACNVVSQAGLALAVGGVGRAGDNDLPIPADLVLAQYPRLGARGALVSRAFFRGVQPIHLSDAISALRARLDQFASCPTRDLLLARDELRLLADRLFHA